MSLILRGSTVPTSPEFTFWYTTVLVVVLLVCVLVIIFGGRK